jgi:SM-20-related protein
VNAILSERPSFQINTALATHELAEQFNTRRCVHVSNFLPHAVATALGRHLVDSTPYQTYVVANEDEMTTNPGQDSVLTAEDEREMLEVACDGARNGFASYFEANRSLSPSAFSDFVQFLSSPVFLNFARDVTGIGEIARAEVQATRFRAGHFQLFSNGTFSADPTGKRRINFELNLTHQWRPEWGGMLEMRGHHGYEVEAVMPCFNSLSLFAFPRGYWISQVTPFAHASRYAISGSLYAD